MVPRQTPYGFHVVTMCTPCGFQVVTTMCQMWTPYDFHMKITLFLCGQNMVSMWLIFHHFYIISVANRSQKIANLWKPVTSLIMVRFSIREKFWKARGVLYQSVVSISQISWDFSMKQDVRESSWCLWCLLVKSRKISAWNKMCKRVRGVCGVFDTMNSLTHLVSCRNLMRFD